MKCNGGVGLEELRELWRAVEPPDQASVAIICNLHPHLLCANVGSVLSFVSLMILEDQLHGCV